MPSNSERIRRRIEIARPQLQKASLAFWEHERMPELFPEYQFSGYCISRALVQGLAVASAGARRLPASDAVAARLADYYDRHIPEETGHDDMILEDIEALGGDRTEVLGRMPSPAVAALVGAQYYWSYHHHPIAFMGYLVVLETDISESMMEEIIERTGLPRKAFRFLLFHARVEPGHIRDIDRTLDSLPLREKHFQIMAISAFTTLTLATRVYEDICRR